MDNKIKTAEQIRNSYCEKGEDKFQQLKNLDKKVKLPAKVTAYTLGVVGSLILGVGMCFAMKVIGNFMPLGIIIGIAGIAIVSANYFIYKAILKSRKRKYADSVIRLSDEILNR